MRSFRAILIFTYFLFFIDISKAQSPSISEIIKSEFATMKLVAEASGVKVGGLIFSEKSNSHILINPEKNISVNINQVDRYTKGKSELFKRLFVRFLVGHEIGHALHISSYNPAILKDVKGESLIFMECFADIVGGLLMNLAVLHIEFPKWKSENPSLDEHNYSDSMALAGREVYKAVFEMDRMNRSMKTHPSNEDRLHAIQHGVEVANIATFFQVLKSASNSAPVDPEKKKFTIGVYRGMARATGYNSESNLNWEDPFTWAHKEAILITHENNLLARNVIVFNQKVKWNESSASPFVDFSVQLLNLNHVPVDIKGRVVSEIVPRENPDDIVRVMPVDGMSYDINIAPGDVAEIKGRLKWLSETGYMPNLLLPPAKRTFYWVFNKDNHEVDTGVTKTRLTDFPKWSERTVNDVIDLVSELMDYRDDIFQFAKGMGLSFEKTFDRAKKGSSVYASKFEEGDDRLHEIFADDAEKIATYSLTLYSGADSKTAKSRFDEMLSGLRKEYSEFSYADHSERPSSYVADFMENNEHVLRLLLFTYNGESKLSIEIYGLLKR